MTTLDGVTAAQQIIMSQLEKSAERKVARVELQYHEQTTRLQFLKLKKQKAIKEIEFYKTALRRLAFLYNLQ